MPARSGNPDPRGHAVLPEKSTPGMTQLEVAGERRLRQLLLAVDLAIFCAIGAIALHLWRLPPGQNVYFKLQQSASFTYLFIWMGISAVGGSDSRSVRAAPPARRHPPSGPVRRREPR